MMGRSDWHDPYAVSGNWYRGNTHLHTFHGPGDSIRTDPRIIVDWYRAHGYHWLNISDHTHITTVEGAWEGFVVLSGHESDCVVAIGVEDRADLADGSSGERAARLEFWVEDIVSRGGVAQLAHPRATLGDWQANLSWVSGLEGLSLIELYNNRQGDYGGEIDWRRPNKYGVDIWDQLLLAGRCMWPVAVDDCHDYLTRPRIDDAATGERRWEAVPDPEDQFYESGGGWTCVLAEDLTPHHLMAGLRRGSVYASQGPVFESIGLRAGRLVAEVSRCQEVHLVVDGESAARFGSSPLEWEMPEPTAGRYVRVELVDASGRRAWSAPFMAR